jgi:hypothetical protein
MPCSLVGGYQLFTATYCLHHCSLLGEPQISHTANLANEKGGEWQLSYVFEVNSTVLVTNKF